MPISPALDLHGVAKLYGRTVALRATDLRMEAGETLALLGPNGSGKTTLLKIIAGAIEPTLGGGTILGYDLRTERPALRSLVGLLAADSYLYDDLTATENLRFILTLAGRKPARAEIESVLRSVALEGYSNERARNFSSGMCRRLALARLLLLHPAFLLLDEPYNNLDAGGAALVDATVRAAAEEGRTTIVATHDAERALALADRVAVLEGGRLSYLGPSGGYRRKLVVG